MQSLKAIGLPLIFLLVASCAETGPFKPGPGAPAVMEVQSARLQPAPAEVMVERPANFQKRLNEVFWKLAPTPTRLPNSSPPARP